MCWIQLPRVALKFTTPKLISDSLYVLYRYQISLAQLQWFTYDHQTEGQQIFATAKM